MARQKLELRVRLVLVDFRTGQKYEHRVVTVEATPTDTLRDIEEALVEEDLVPPPQPGQGFKWLVVTASGEETPVSNTTTVGQIVDMYQPRELQLLFDVMWE